LFVEHLRWTCTAYSGRARGCGRPRRVAHAGDLPGHVVSGLTLLVVPTDMSVHVTEEALVGRTSDPAGVAQRNAPAATT
jgi:hypothetical protein